MEIYKKLEAMHFFTLPSFNRSHKEEGIQSHGTVKYVTTCDISFKLKIQELVQI